MPRPPSDRVEEGFAIWSTEAERNDTKTAELMGLGQTTVSYWRRTYGWDERYFTLTQPDGELLAGVARAEIRAALPIVVTRLRCIIAGRKPVFNDNGEQIGETWAAADRDAIQAAKLLAQYGFEGGTGLDSTIVDAYPVELPGVAEPEGELSVAQLRRQAAAMIEATVQAVNTRPARGRKRV